MTPNASLRHAPLTLWLAAIVPSAGCVQTTDFDPEDGVGETTSSPNDGSGPTSTTAAPEDTGTTAASTDASTAGTGITESATTDASESTAAEVPEETSTTGMGVGETETDTLTETTDAGDTESEPLPDCPGVGLGAGSLGDACSANDQCASGVCTIYTEAPINLDAVCADPPLDCSMRVTGTSLDIVTGQPIAGAELRVVTALQSVTNPAGAAGIVSGPSAADGRLDLVTPGPAVAPIWLVAMLEAPGYQLTGTPMATPLEEGGTSYAVANDVHDLWLVSDTALAAWSSVLALDPAIPPELLPLGPAGGVVGIVRDADGVPASGATVSSSEPLSSALVRYLNDDATFGTVATGSLGLFVILDPGLGEPFEAELDGASLGTIGITTTPGAVFTMAFTAP